MVFGLFKKKEEEDIPEDIGFETPPTLANPTGFSSAPNLPPLPGANPSAPTQTPTQNIPMPPAPAQPSFPQTTQQTYTPPYAPRAQPTYNPDLENQVKLLQTKVESITVQLNTLSQKLDYIINMLRSQGRY